MSQQYRYPGVTPFTKAQSNIFFGRNEEIEGLYKMILREQVVVLYGKSGLGKSSLLNAGVFPLLEKEKDAVPLMIRFGASTGGDEKSPLERTKEAIPSQFQSNSLLNRLNPNDQALWKYAKQHQIDGKGNLFLVFDQFEELFSYPEALIDQFKQELSELLRTSIPTRFRIALDKIDSEVDETEEDMLYEPLNACILFSIRSDKLHMIDRLKDYFPTVLRHSYELLPLQLEGAKNAIVKPAQMLGDFKTPAFSYEQAALDKLLHYLQDQESGKVEAILIQMLCEHYEKKEVEEINLRTLNLAHIGNPDEVVKNYYNEKIEDLNPQDQVPAQLLIEDGLVSEGEGMRLTLHESLIEQQYQVDKSLLNKLVDSRLLRSEPFIRGGYTYELSHDRLIPAVKQSRDHRKALEAEREQAAEAERLRLQMETDRLEKEKTQRQLRLVRGLLVLAVVALCVAGFFAWNANRQQKIALKAEKIAIDAQEAAEKERDSAQKARDQIALEKNATEEQRKIAEDNLKRADEANAEAKKERDKTQQALIELEQKVQQILKNAELDVLSLRYEAALKKIQSLENVGVAKGAVATALLEIAFYHNEIGDRHHALGLLSRTASLLEQPFTLSLKSDSIQARQQLRDAMQQFFPSHFDYLFGEKYYPKMVVVKGGTFWMGCDTTLNQICGDDETWHQQTVSDFKMAKYETTWWQYFLFCKATGHEYRSPEWGTFGDNPAVGMSWFDAILYSNWVNRQLGLEEVYAVSNKRKQGSRDYYDVDWKADTKGFQLPTEAQWEYAAKGGTARSPFVYSGDSLLAEVAWYYSNSDGRTQKVGTKKPNALGLYDLSGNVWEWCWEKYARYSEGITTKYRRSEEGTFRIVRGGSWYNDSNPVSFREYVDPEVSYYTSGVRLLRY